MKLQELLDKHKDKLFNWTKEVKVLTEYIWDDCNTIIQLLQQWLWWIIYKSLSDILFSTPFLSLLEWKRNNTWTSRQMQHNKSGAMIKMANFTSPLFHKINLVLLNTDEERIKYIEQFTL